MRTLYFVAGVFVGFEIALAIVLFAARTNLNWFIEVLGNYI